MSDFVWVIEIYKDRTQTDGGHYFYPQTTDVFEVKAEAEIHMETFHMHTYELCEDPIPLSWKSATFLWVDNTNYDNYVLVKSKPLVRPGHMSAMFPFHKSAVDKGT